MATTDEAAEDAFAALGNEHRIETLRVVARAAESGEGGLSFTEIYDRTGLESTSQLSYHLDQLADGFLRRAGEQYMLTDTGERIVRAIRAGTYATTPSFEPTTVDGQCPDCDATTLRATHSNRNLAVTCVDCETTVVTYDLRPAEVDGREPLETLRSCNRRARQEYETAVDGTCPACSAATEVDIEEGPDGGYACEAACPRCRLELFAPVEVLLFSHPAVIAFYWDRGTDVTDIELWRLPTFIGDAVRRVRDTDPLQLELTLFHDGDRLTATIDADSTVTVDGVAPSPPQQ